MPDLRAVQATVRGVVQGVGFRAATLRKAYSLGVAGWCRNEKDGSVSVFAQGEPEAVDMLIEWLSTGPRPASVRAVSVRETMPQPQLEGFTVR